MTGSQPPGARLRWWTSLLPRLCAGEKVARFSAG